jgi:hypothetical protein
MKFLIKWEIKKERSVFNLYSPPDIVRGLMAQPIDTGRYTELYWRTFFKISQFQDQDMNVSIIL